MLLEVWAWYPFPESTCTGAGRRLRLPLLPWESQGWAQEFWPPLWEGPSHHQSSQTSMTTAAPSFPGLTHTTVHPYQHREGLEVRVIPDFGHRTQLLPLQLVHPRGDYPQFHHA